MERRDRREEHDDTHYAFIYLLSSSCRYYFSDTHFSEASESQVLNAEAYLLFYERVIVPQ